MTGPRLDRSFLLLFTVMLTIAAGNTALQSVLPALGRSLGVADSAVAAAFSVSALLWVIAAPLWANRSDRRGRKGMVLLGSGGFTVSLLLCGSFLAAGINGWIAPTTAFLLFVGGRMIYGGFGSAAPPAVQALVAARTTREERTRALSLLASAFGLGTILGPALAPYLVLGGIGSVEIGLASPAFVFAAFGVVVWLTVARALPRDEPPGAVHGAATSYPSIGGQSSGASVTAATSDEIEKVGYFDRAVRPWIVSGLIMGHAQTMLSQTIGFLVIDRLAVAPMEALQPTGLVLMMGAGAALLAQWGVIPIMNFTPRVLILVGVASSTGGAVIIAGASSLYTIALGFALAAFGFGLSRPGVMAGSSLAVGQAAQGSVAGKVTSINGAAFVLGPSLGVGLYELWHPLPYAVAAAGLVFVFGYGLVTLRAPAAPASRA